MGSSLLGLLDKVIFWISMIVVSFVFFLSIAAFMNIAAVFSAYIGLRSIIGGVLGIKKPVRWEVIIAFIFNAMPTFLFWWGDSDIHRDETHIFENKDRHLLGRVVEIIFGLSFLGVSWLLYEKNPMVQFIYFYR